METTAHKNGADIGLPGLDLWGATPKIAGPVM
jgi:hypothetical protein